MSLRVIAIPAACEPGPLATRYRSLTVAKVDSIGLVAGMKRREGSVLFRWLGVLA